MITYRGIQSDWADVTVANCELPLYGRWTKLEITSYVINDGIAISFSIEPISSNIRNNRTFDATTDKRQLTFARQYNGSRQTFNQVLTFPKIKGTILHWSELNGGGVDAGRVVARSMLRNVESIAESVRYYIRRSIGGEVKEQVLSTIDERYQDITRKALYDFLREINWKFMFRQIECDEDTLTVIIGSLPGNNVVQCHPISFDGDTGIPLTFAGESFHFDRKSIADLKATGLLRSVCGNVLADEFEKTGGITIEQNDYKFHMKPNSFVDCWDANGRHTRLCIHTVNFMVNPIDELTIAYLNIRNKFYEYMRMAVYHGMSPGFVKPCYAEFVA